MQQFEENFAVAQLGVQVPDAISDANVMRVDPFSERLLLDTLALV